MSECIYWPKLCQRDCISGIHRLTVGEATRSAQELHANPAVAYNRPPPSFPRLPPVARSRRSRAPPSSFPRLPLVIPAPPPPPVIPAPPLVVPAKAGTQRNHHSHTNQGRQQPSPPASPSSFPRRPPSSFPRRREPSATITRIPTKVANNPHHRRPPSPLPRLPLVVPAPPRSSWPRRGPPVRSKALAYAGTMSYAKVSTGRNLALANWPLGNPGAGGTGYSRHPPHPVHPVHLCQFNPPYLDTRTPVRLLCS